MVKELEGGRLIDRYYAEAVAEDEEFAEEFASNFGANQRYTDSVLTEVYLAFNEGVLGVEFDEESGHSTGSKYRGSVQGLEKAKRPKCG